MAGRGAVAPADTRSHSLVLGTHTSDDSPNYLMLVDAVLQLPPHLAAATVAEGRTPRPRP